jgi:predicted Zn-dependent protease
MKVKVKQDFECPTNGCNNNFSEGEIIEITWQGVHYCEECGKPIHLIVNDDNTVEL